MTDPLSVTAAAISITSFGIAACKSGLDFYRSAKSSRRDIGDLYESIERLQKTLNEVETVVQRSSHCGVAATVSDNLEACRSGLGRLAHKIEKSRKSMNSPVVRSLPAALQYPFKESTINKLKDVVSRELMGHLNLCVNVLHLDVAHVNHQYMQTGLSSINENIESAQNETRVTLNEIRDTVSNVTILMNTHGNEDRRDKILTWISTSDQNADYHQRACQQREPNTGNWFVHSDRYRRWKDDLGSFFWLHGIPGCGKTVLCSTIIEETKTFCSRRDLYYIAYYYFSFNDAVRQKTKSMLRSLIYQILKQQSSVPDAVLALYNSHEHEQPTEEGMLKAFKTIITSSRQLYIVVDALDECPNDEGERSMLVSMLETLKDFDLPNLHILATSRKETELAEIERLVTFPPIEIQSDDVDDDILLHVRMQLCNNPKLCKWPEDIKNEIGRRLTEDAHGMFRLVSCQLDSLEKCLRATAVKQTLETLPRTLDETYDRILLNIDQAYRKEALLALMWLLFSTRPLSLSEIAEAMVIDNSAEQAFSTSDRFFNPKSAIAILSSLVAVTTMPRSIILRYRKDMVHLAHYSVKEYLTSTRAREGPAACFAINQTVAQEQIVQCCLNYIKYCSLQDWSQDFPLLSYASSTWFVHAKACDNEITEHTMEMIVGILNEPGIWTVTFDPEEMALRRDFALTGHVETRLASGSLSDSSETPSAIYYAACLGLDEVVRFLLRHGSDPNEECGRYGNALQAASLRNHASVATTLIQNGADDNKRGGFYGSAMNAACFGGNAQIVNDLIQAGADVKSQASPLDHVRKSLNPSREIVMQLLAQNTLSYAEGKTKGWLMRWAAASGYDDIVRLLIDELQICERTSFDWTFERPDWKDVWPKIGPSYQRRTSAPYEAVINGHEAIAKLLVEKWAHVDEDDGEGRTSLYWACFLQYPRIVKALLENGADIHRAGPNEWTPRHWVTLFNNLEILRLLDRVCEPSSCDRCAAAESEAKAENVSISASAVPNVTLDEEAGVEFL